ncbi:MAG: iron-containing redox enzyme family protein [Deltaproteobacteria bacterium]|nr:iron-containing redox enzyme family protein [Deltaproteobacteria bacterium]
MNRADFVEALLKVMERKTHWAWPAFTSGRVPRNRLHIHLEQEYATYVRDFPILLGLAHVQCPIAAVRQELAANLFEEETGGLVAGRAHPELFLDIPRGLGYDLARFARVELLPEAARYRALLDELAGRRGWEIGVAITTLFIEGTAHERQEIAPTHARAAVAPLSEHPLVKHYGLPAAALTLAEAHRKGEGEHRAAAWRMVLDHLGEPARAPVVAAMENVLAAWLTYRDGVARACGLARSPTNTPELAT